MKYWLSWSSLREKKLKMIRLQTRCHLYLQRNQNKHVHQKVIPFKLIILFQSMALINVKWCFCTKVLLCMYIMSYVVNITDLTASIIICVFSHRMLLFNMIILVLSASNFTAPCAYSIMATMLSPYAACIETIPIGLACILMSNMIRYNITAQWREDWLSPSVVHHVATRSLVLTCLVTGDLF